MRLLQTSRTFYRLRFSAFPGRHRRAFTMVELLVVIAIVLVLTAVTITSFNFSVDADRMRAGARQVQSLLVGARDKAIYAKSIRGVRLLLDPNDNHAVSAVQYIGAPQREVGTLTFDPAVTGDGTGLTVNRLQGTRWGSLKNRGLLRVGARIQIPIDTGTWYVVSSAFNANNDFLTLDRPNSDLAGSVASVGFALEMGSSALSDAQPIELPRGVVIDLDGSQIPTAWRPILFGGSYYPQMDILFNSRGQIVGDCDTLGLIHLHFADASDVLKWKQIGGRSATFYSSSALPLVPADDPNSTVQIVTRDRILTSVMTRTGNVSVHHVNSANQAIPPELPIQREKLADDPFLFAETGQVANK